MAVIAQHIERARPLYKPNEVGHDACGVGIVANSSGNPNRIILPTALRIGENVTQRGATLADGKTSDGAGIMTGLPGRYYGGIAQSLGARVDTPGSDLAVAMVFAPQEKDAQNKGKANLEDSLKAQGIQLVGWRDVPVNPDVLGPIALASMPHISQLFATRPSGMDSENFDKALIVARKVAEQKAQEDGVAGFYIPSLSRHTVVYKGLMSADKIALFYEDLQKPDYETQVALVHQRFSTNVTPRWELAQPFRYLGHNGEINTIDGNANWMRARQTQLLADALGVEPGLINSIISAGGSDSAKLDEALEIWGQQLGGDYLHALRMMVPPAWEKHRGLPPEVREFYRYGSAQTEPWDGPAALYGTDGRVAFVVQDRNGLRPARYRIDDDGIITVESEAGAGAREEARVVKKGLLGPGEMLAVDMRSGAVMTNAQIEHSLASAQDYEALNNKLFVAVEIPNEGAKRTALSLEEITILQRAHGISREEEKDVLGSMFAEGKDWVFSMGNDATLATISTVPRRLSGNFKQHFAQVTNPPIDPLREDLVMSLRTLVGGKEGRIIELDSPILTRAEMAALENSSLNTATIEALFSPRTDPADFQKDVLEKACDAALQAVDKGVSVIKISDKGISGDKIPIPMGLLVGAINQKLLSEHKREGVALIVETGDAVDIHDFAFLIGAGGATAIYPYLAYDSAQKVLAEQKKTEINRAKRDQSLMAQIETKYKGDELINKAEANLKKAIDAGLLKIMSKMGISPVQSYRGAMIFEALNIDPQVIEMCFPGMNSNLGGVGFEGLAQLAIARHAEAYASKGQGRLLDIGEYRNRKDQIGHAWAPDQVRKLHTAVETGNMDAYMEFADAYRAIDRTHNIRSLLDVKYRDPIPLEEVEPVESILRRFVSSAMSLGALSPEAHLTLTIASNLLGMRSNSGEGGEKPKRSLEEISGEQYANLIRFVATLPPDERYDNPEARLLALSGSAIRQVASGRWGVDALYLALAKEIEIKMAQGAKPGEGGQLPGRKVTRFISDVRGVSQAGIDLISPPPHHDIYSIEDLAQLIYDLKRVNPAAAVGVKLVAESGVGTIAAGVAKAYADYVLISGYEGGTGAAPASSIKGVGIPLELGLAESHQVLVRDNLRSRLRVRADGGFKTGHEILTAAVLGAEEFGMGTFSVVAIGCDMARACHLNTCEPGIATQDPTRRANFADMGETVGKSMRGFKMMAESVRYAMAARGIRSLDEIIGKPHLLTVRQDIPSITSLIDLRSVMFSVDPASEKPRFHQVVRNELPLETTLDSLILGNHLEAIRNGQDIALGMGITVKNRTVGATVAYEMTKLRNNGVEPGNVELKFAGSAGESFGAFAVKGMTLVLEGEANDYVGKGLSGGEIIIRPPQDSRLPSDENAIIGNTVLYGATGGRLFASGKAGVRFGVRNSGAVAVVEGAGDHLGEYQTDGTIVVLGEVGRNVGAGQSGGKIIIPKAFAGNVNTEMVRILPIQDEEDRRELYGLVSDHYERTGSEVARDIRDTWDAKLGEFVMVVPKAKEQPIEELAKTLAAQEQTSLVGSVV